MSSKKSTRDGIDKQTLEYMYVDLVMPVGKIAEKCGKTRQTVWGYLKKYGLHKQSRVVRECLYCKKGFKVVRSRVRAGGGKYCSEKCYFEHKREVGDYQPWRQGQRRSRQMIENWLGFSLPVDYVVHHEDGDCRNCEFENLWVFPSQGEHLKYHHAKREGGGELPYGELWELPGKIEEWLNS